MSTEAVGLEPVRGLLVRRATPFAALALAVALGLGLSACSGGGTPTPTASGSSAVNAQDLAVLAGVKVTGDLGKAPKVTLPATPFNVSSFVASLVQDGTGAAIATGQTMSINEVAISGADGSQLGSTWESGPQTLTAGVNSSLGNLDQILLKAHVGARLLVAYPATGATSTTAASTQVIAIDVMSAYSVLQKATGQAVPPVTGLPTVALAASGEPSITPVGGTAPKALVAQPLIKGTGAAVAKGQVVTVHYSGWLWDGTAFDSSWSRKQPYTFQVGATPGQVIPGWDEGLVGQTIGSQVLLVVPPDKAYGAAGQGSIPANATLVFVVDILDAR